MVWLGRWSGIWKDKDWTVISHERTLGINPSERSQNVKIFALVRHYWAAPLLGFFSELLGPENPESFCDIVIYKKYVLGPSDDQICFLYTFGLRPQFPAHSSKNLRIS